MAQVGFFHLLEALRGWGDGGGTSPRGSSTGDGFGVGQRAPHVTPRSQPPPCHHPTSTNPHKTMLPVPPSPPQPPGPPPHTVADSTILCSKSLRALLYLSTARRRASAAF